MVKNDIVNKMEDFIKDFNKKNPVICDVNCQQNNNKKKLYTNYINAKNNLLNGRDNLEKAERDYYYGTGQSQVYSELQERRAATVIKNYMDNIQEHFQENINDIKKYLKYYESQKIMEKYE